MTLKEYMYRQHPDCVGREFLFGVNGCPDDYEDLQGHYEKRYCRHNDCKKCWSQELINDKTEYNISLVGCDDETCFTMALTEEQAEIVKLVAEKANETSQYSCMPRMYIDEVKEADNGSIQS